MSRVNLKSTLSCIWKKFPKIYLENIIRQESRFIMFKKELSVKLLKIIDERKLTVKGLSELANLSRNYVSNIIDEKQVPTIDSLENICSGLNVTPDELLISDKSKMSDKAKPMPVTEVFCTDDTFNTKHKPICPNCKKLLGRDNQAYCDMCGQRLSWHNYRNAELVLKLPEVKG